MKFFEMSDYNKCRCFKKLENWIKEIFLILDGYSIYTGIVYLTIFLAQNMGGL